MSRVGLGQCLAVLVPASLCLVLTGFLACTWDSGDLRATANSFKANKTAFEAAVLEVKRGVRAEAVQSKYPILTAHGYAANGKPLVVEFSPVSFYYVIVYVEDAKNLHQSEVMQDEGVIKRRLGGGWFIVQRGWM